MKGKEERIKTKRAKNISIIKGGANEPVVTEANYKLDLIGALAYYNIESDYKTLKGWLKNYLTKHSVKVGVLSSSLHDSQFQQMGILARLVERGQYVSPEHIAYIPTKLAELEQKILKLDRVQKGEEVLVPEIDKDEFSFYQLMPEIDAEIDTFMITKNSTFSMKNFLSLNNASKKTSSLIRAVIERQHEEVLYVYNEIDNQDDQLVEGYGNFNKRELKRFVDLLQSMLDGCLQQRVARKPRTKKIKPASVQVNKLQFTPTFNIGVLEYKSEKPEKLIGAKEAWFYDTEKRKIHVYRSTTGMGVKGTTITDYDVVSSMIKGIRKPELFFDGDTSKSNLNNAYKKLTTIEVPVKGRINKNMIILKVL